MTFVSYAQNFEDVMLHRALGHVKQGFFVDVGAQHPVDDSVTKAFSLLGWRGINIEPVRHWYDLIVEDRPYDINLNLAVGDGDGLVIFEVEETGWSTGDRALSERYREEGKIVHEHHVPATTLDRILDEQRVEVVHFLKVDCEGAERVALESCSFDRVRPWIVVVEATEPNSQIPSHQEWEHILTGRDYLFTYFDGLNRYYVAKERPELLAAFSVPPNVFDNFMRAHHYFAHAERHRLQHESVALHADLTQSRAVVTHLSESLDATHREHAERLSVSLEATRMAEARFDKLEREGAVLRGRLEKEWALARDQLEHEWAAARVRLEQESVAARSRLEHEVNRRDQIIGMLVTSTSWRITAPLRGAKAVLKGALRHGWRVARPVVARGARAARPAMHAALKVPGVRPVARRVFGPQTRVGGRVRRFLFPGSVAHVSAPLGPVILNEHAQAMDTLLRAAIARRSRPQG